MFYGVTKNKLDLANAQCEDSLTSSVFERLALLSDENLWWVLRNACDKQALAANPLPVDVGKLEKVEFWPSWKPDSKLKRNNLRVEPDVFLRFKDLDIIVEAKRSDFEQSQNEEQWQNELGAWCQKFQTDRPVVLLAIGGNSSVGTCEVELKHLKQQFRVEKLNWGMLCDAVFELSNRFSNDTHLAHVVDQLDIVFDFFGVISLKMRWLCNLRSISVENVNPSQLSSALADVRKAYRILVPFQEQIKNALLYIKEQYPHRFSDEDINVEIYPFGVFADNVIKGTKAKIIEYPKVELNDKTYYQDVNLVGYSIVWFGGPSVFNHKRIYNQVAELWGFVVPDDRLITNRLHGIDDILNMQDAEDATGYIVLFATIDNKYNKGNFIGDCIDTVFWLVEKDKNEGLAKIRELLNSPSDEEIMSKEDKISIMKRYPLEKFADKRHTDCVLRDFAKLVLDESGIKIFKDPFYESSTPSTKWRKLSSALALADVRKANRILVPFQEMIKNTLLYIKKQCRFYDKDTDIKLYPFGAFAERVIEIDSHNIADKLDEIEVKFNDKTYYQNISLVEYSIVRFVGPNVFSRKHTQVAELWGFIVPDDRLAMNRLCGIDNVLNVQDAENASGYIVLFAAIGNNYPVEVTDDELAKDVLWLVEDDEDDGLGKVCELLSSPSDEKIMSKDDDMSILKRYRLEEFADKQSTDRVLRDFAKLVLEEGKVKIFKDRFYSEN